MVFESRYHNIEDLMLMVFAAGATSGFNCSLCYAGTYLTGSGQDLLDGEKLIYLASVAMICFFLFLRQFIL